MKTTLLSALAIYALLSANAAAQTPLPTPTPSPTPEPPELVIDQIKKSVVFIEGDYLSRPEMQMVNGTPQLIQNQRNILGTGFLIFWKDQRIGKDGGFFFLVTNRHMIREPNANGVLGEGPYFKELTVRLNTKKEMPNGTQLGVMRSVVVDDQGTLEWFTDPEETVDLAVTPIGLDFTTMDAVTIPSDLFATKDVLKRERINEMDEILFAGLFARNPGAKKNYPIVRHGKLARLSAEPIPIDPLHPGKSVEVHLADVMSFGGNSGSPVFLRVGALREGNSVANFGYSYYLLGVMQGYFPENMEVAVNVAVTRGIAAENSGIAAVVPADKIVSIMSTPRAQAYRERIVADYALRDGKMDDAEIGYKKAIDLLQQSAPLTMDFVRVLENYAVLMRRKKLDKEASKSEERAKAIRNNIQLDLMHPRM